MSEITIETSVSTTDLRGASTTEECTSNNNNNNNTNNNNNNGNVIKKESGDVSANVKSEALTAVPASAATTTSLKDFTEFTIPPHVMGQDITDPSNNDLANGSGKRMQKPRFGVKVPYRNLTSKIVTQDEIAQEIFERSLRRYTEQLEASNNLLKSIKLNNHNLSAGSIIQTLPNTQSAPVKVEPTIIQPSSSTSSSVIDNSPIKDNNELLAILDGSPEKKSDKSNVSVKNVKSEAKVSPASPYKFIKLYPELEKELALKQLEEFSRPKKKKEESVQVNKYSVKKRSIKREKKIAESSVAGSNIKRKMKGKIKSEKIVTKVGKPGRKRKVDDGIIKREIGLNTKKKRIVKNTVNGETSNVVVTTVADVSQITEIPIGEDGALPTVPLVKDSRYIKKYSNKRFASRLSDSPEVDSLSKYDFNEDDDNYGVNFSVSSIPKSNKKTVNYKKGDIVVSSNGKPKIKELEEEILVPGKKKTRVMREIDRLLGDEGAINMLYSVEQKRTPGNTPNRRGILPSTRRKKKDLLLKTRLVKNAVLRLSSSPSQASNKTPSLRGRSQSNTAVDSLGDLQGLDSPQRKMSVDSKDSVPSTSLNSPAHSPGFAYPSKLSVPAEASRIIRRHSSSSSYSSRSNSPRRPSVDADRFVLSSSVVSSSPEKSVSELDSNSPKKSHSPVKKLQVDHSIQNELAKQHILNMINDSSKMTVNELSERAERLLDMKYKEIRVQNQEIINKLLGRSNQDTAIMFKKDIHDLVKSKLCSEFSKTLKKNLLAAKLSKPKGSQVLNEIQHGKQFVNPLAGRDACAATASTCLSAVSSCEQNSDTSTASTTANSNNSELLDYVKSYESRKKRDGEEKSRSSIRQNAGAYAYKEISLRRYDHLVQIILTPVSTKMKNAFNLQVFKEITNALNCLRKDNSCKVVLFTSTGSAFCLGIDLTTLIHPTPEKRKNAALELVIALKDFVKSIATFNKPLIAGVHGAAVGLGVTMLPFFDMVIASDKATFHTPYARLGQIPEGAATLTLPQMLGNAVTSELLFGCRKLTAAEALHFGLVTRILWPDRFQEELIPLIRSIATQSSQSMEATKAMLRQSLCSKLDTALLSESQLLIQHWMSDECQNCFKQYLEEETPTLPK